MKSKVSAHQPVHSVLQILNLVFLTVVVIFVLAASSLAQSRLPFVGTRTFCGEHEYQLSGAGDGDPKLKWETKTTVTIRTDGFTTVKTNAYGPLYVSPNTDVSIPSPYLTFSGKLTLRKTNIMENGGMRSAMAVCDRERCLSFLSASEVEVTSVIYEWAQDETELCPSERATLKKSNDVQRPPVAPGNAVSNSAVGVDPQSAASQQIAPDTLVANLYRQAGSPDRVFQTRSRVLLDQYFEKQFADLIRKEVGRPETIEATDEGESFSWFLYPVLGNGGYDEISKSVIGKPSYSYQGKKAQVIASYDVVHVGWKPSMPKRSVSKDTIIFLLAAGEAGWKITDIKYDDGKTSLLEEFRKDFKGTSEPPIKKNDPAPANVEPQPTSNTATSRPRVQAPNLGTPTSETVNETKTDSSAIELSYWETIKSSTDPEDFKAYLAKYPNGRFAELAKSRVEQLTRPVSNPASSDVAAAERARNTRTFEVRDSSKTSGWLTVAPGSVTFEPKRPKEGKSITIQCSEIKHIEQGQSTVATAHVNLFLNGKEAPVVFYTSSGGTGVVGVFVKGLPAKPVVDITTSVINAITETCR